MASGCGEPSSDRVPSREEPRVPRSKRGLIDHVGPWGRGAVSLTGSDTRGGVDYPRTAMRKQVTVWVLGLVLVTDACTGTPHRAEPRSVESSPIPCGRVARLEQYPSSGFGKGVNVGPLWLFGFAKGVHARVLFGAGFPTKILIHPRRPFHDAITLRGWRCIDHRTLRFWYRRGALPLDVPASVRALESTGDSVAVLHPYKRLSDYPGYMLFSAPGLWAITFEQANRSIGSVTLEVS